MTKPRRYESPTGLAVHVNANGSIRRMDHGDIVLNLFPGTEMEGGPANLYLRRLGNQISWTPLLGPRSPLARDARRMGETHHALLYDAKNIGIERPFNQAPYEK